MEGDLGIISDVFSVSDMAFISELLLTIISFLLFFKFAICVAILIVGFRIGVWVVGKYKS